MMLSLAVQAREQEDSADRLRKGGRVPAVFYGAKESSTPISIESRELERAWKQAGETTIVSLQGLGENKEALFRDVQMHPLTGSILHADFYVLEKGKKIEIDVPLSWEGAAPAEKAGHIVVKAMHEISIKVEPHELPHTLAVDLTKLENVGDHLKAADIALPASATLITDPDEIVASVTEFIEEKEEAPAVAPETVITTGKAAEEGAEAAPAEEKKAE